MMMLHGDDIAAALFGHPGRTVIGMQIVNDVLWFGLVQAAQQIGRRTVGGACLRRVEIADMRRQEDALATASATVFLKCPPTASTGTAKLCFTTTGSGA